MTSDFVRVGTVCLLGVFSRRLTICEHSWRLTICEQITCKDSITITAKASAGADATASTLGIYEMC
jgi:hypothetical protein